MSKKKKTADNQKKELQRIYVGPSLAGEIMLAQNQVFRGELPARIKEVIAKHPEIGQAIIAVEDLGRIRKKLQDPKSGIAGRFKMLKGLKK